MKNIQKMIKNPSRLELEDAEVIGMRIGEIINGKSPVSVIIAMNAVMDVVLAMINEENI